MPAYDYQIRAVSLLADAINREKLRAIILCLPTGAGKTWVLKLIIERALARGKRVCVLVHGRDLIEQTSKALDAAGIPHGVVMANHKMVRPELPVQVCSVDTLVSQAFAPPADWVISDECHHDSASTRAAILRCWDKPIVIGLTATPERSDRQPLGPNGAGYQKIIEVVTIAELQDRWARTEGREGLVPLHTYSHPDMKPSKLPAEDALTMVRRLGLGELPGLVFCEDKSHARLEARRFCEAGISAESVCDDDVSGPVERSRVGVTRVLTTVQKLTEGSDLPWLRWGAIQRGCAGWPTFMQMVGRLLRRADGKPYAVLLDPYGHVYRGWNIGVPRVFSLDGTPSKPIAYMPPARQCKVCGCVATPALACPRCGMVQPPPEAKKAQGKAVQRVSVAKLAHAQRAQWEFLQARIREHREREAKAGKPISRQWISMAYFNEFRAWPTWKFDAVEV